MTEQYMEPENRPIRRNKKETTVVDPTLPDLEIPGDAAAER
jgi:hypothetical protein